MCVRQQQADSVKDKRELKSSGVLTFPAYDVWISTTPLLAVSLSTLPNVSLYVLAQLIKN